METCRLDKNSIVTCRPRVRSHIPELGNNMENCKMEIDL